MSSSCLIPSNPDVSGIGVRIAIYLQNILCFVPAVWAIWDGKVSDYELESAEIHSTTNLVLAFAILISCIFQALTRGLSNYHSSIVLSLSWMNNTNAFVYFLLYVQYKSQDGGVEPERSAWSTHLKLRVKTILCLTDAGRRNRTSSRKAKDAAKVIFRRVALFLGSIHLTLMASLGIWLWSSPKSFGTSDSATCVTQLANLTILGIRARFGSSVLRIISLFFYTLFLLPGLNLLLPIVLFLSLHCWYHTWRSKDKPLLPQRAAPDAQIPPSPKPRAMPLTLTLSSTPNPPVPPPPEVDPATRILQVLPVYLGLTFLLAVNIIFIADIELTIRGNRHLQDAGESQWGFGQILALLLVFMPLRDLVEAMFRRRQEIQTKLDNALKKAVDDKNWEDMSRWIAAKANPNVRTDNGQTALEVATWERKWPLVRVLVKAKANVNITLTDETTVFEATILANEWQLVQDLIQAGVDVTVRFRVGHTALEMASVAQKWLVVRDLVRANVDIDIQFTDGTTVFEAATLAHEWQLVQDLIQSGVRVTRKFQDGQTALEVVTLAQNWPLVRTLVDARADVNTVFADGTTVLEVATLAMEWKLVQVLIQAGADFERQFQDDDTKTLLHAVCHHKENGLLTLLLGKGVNCAVTNSGGRTAYEVAMQAQNIEGAASVARKVLESHPAAHPNRPSSLRNLANALVKTRSLANRRESIRLLRDAIKVLPSDGLDISPFHHDLADALQSTASSVYDRDESISLCREALELRPAGHPDRRNSIDDLASALLRKGTPVSIRESYSLLRQALSLPPPGDLRSLRHLRGSLGSLVHTIRRKGTVIGVQEIEESIALIREALVILPDGHDSRGEIMRNLAISLEDTGSIDNMREVILLERQALQLCPPGHPNRPTSLNSVAYSLTLVYDATGTLSDLEEAIKLARESIALVTKSSSTYRYLLANLAMALHFLPEYRDEALDLIRQAIPLWPLHSPTPFDITRLFAPMCFFYYQQTGAVKQLKEAAEWCERGLSLCSPNHCCRPKLVALKCNIDSALSVVPSAPSQSVPMGKSE